MSRHAFALIIILAMVMVPMSVSGQELASNTAVPDFSASAVTSQDIATANATEATMELVAQYLLFQEEQDYSYTMLEKVQNGLAGVGHNSPDLLLAEMRLRYYQAQDAQDFGTMKDLSLRAEAMLAGDDPTMMAFRDREPVHAFLSALSDARNAQSLSPSWLWLGLSALVSGLVLALVFRRAWMFPVGAGIGIYVYFAYLMNISMFAESTPFFPELPLIPPL